MINIIHKKIFKKLTIIVATLLMAILPTTLVMASSHTAKDQICAGINTGPGASCGSATGGSKVNDVIKIAVNIFSVVVGIIAVFMVIIGGLKYVTSSGDSSNITSAKNTILYALVGLIVVALAQVLVRFVLDRAA